MPDIIKEASTELVIISPLETSLVITEDAEFRVVEVIDRGVQGPQGERGPDGKTPDHEWVGTALRFEKPDGTWSKLVDLQGPKGERGPTGYISGGGFDPSGSGGAGFNPSGLGMATDMPLPTEMLVQQGGAWVRATWAQVVTWLGGVVPPVGGGVILTEDGGVLLTEDNDRLEME